jgi:hypothetical protein
MKRKRSPLPGNVRPLRMSPANNQRVLTNKAGRQVGCENMMQRKLALLMERERSVLDYASFPEKFYHVDLHGVQIVHVPFLKVWNENGRIEIHDVIEHDKRISTEFCDLERTISEICLARGWAYIVHTPKTLPSETELANLDELRCNAALCYADEPIMSAISRLVSGGPTTIAEIRTSVSRQMKVSPGDVFSTLAHMIWHGYVDADLSQLIIVNGYISGGNLVWIGSMEKTK